MSHENLTDEQWHSEKIYGIVKQWVCEDNPNLHWIGVHSVTAIHPPGQVRWTSKVHAVFSRAYPPSSVKGCRELTLDVYATGGKVHVTCTGDEAKPLCPQCLALC